MKRVWIGILVILVGLAALFVLAPGFVLNLVSRGADVSVEYDVSYGGDPRMKLDVYRPANATNAPVVVFFYGGSWQRGDKSIYRFVGNTLARAGIVAVIPNYRLYPPVLYPDFLRDSALAVRWAKDNAARFGGDPTKLFLSGHSAGAYNAVSLATDRRWLAEAKLEPKADLAGVIGIAGPYDFLPLKDEQLKIIFGPEEARPKTQPIHYVNGDEPPLLLLRPANDTVVDPGNSARLAKRIEEKGGKATLKTYDRVGHLSIIGTLSPLLSFLAPTKNDFVDFVRQRSMRSASPVAR
ncbi:MAG: alpha/beta hydrolase [Xanthobacteraceae bacterium]|nr:alpha/beta hydrolase [Xanthobacteraceae bacterium]